jgi:putative ATP-dependent endonuclease of OLD family
VRTLQQLACGNDQVVVTTHTPTLVRALPSSSLRFLSRDAAGQRSIQCGGDDAVNAAIAASLAVLPDHAVKVFVIVEGVHDITFLKNLSSLLRSHGEAVPDLDALEVAGELVFVSACGSNNLALWASRLHMLKRPEFHLYDRDANAVEPPKHQAKIDSVNLRPTCKAVSTTRREMENFIHHEAVNACANAVQLPLAINAPFGHDSDVPAVLVLVLNQLAPASSKWGHNRVKAWVAEVVLATMTPEIVAEVDPGRERQAWLEHIYLMLRQGA